MVNNLLDERVVERTRELTSQRDSLQHFIDLDEVSRTRTSNTLNSKLSTLIGFVRLARIDPSKAAIHTQHAEMVAGEMKVVIQKMKNDK